jgi:hypothetical protein
MSIGVDRVADASRFHVTEAGIAVVTKKSAEKHTRDDPEHQ